jgi:hypothetical protein
MMRHSARWSSPRQSEWFFLWLSLRTGPFTNWMGTLTETVYCIQPIGFVDSSRPNFVCRLNKSLYSLKQAPRAWHHRFASHLISLGFVEAKSDTSLFIYRRGTDTALLLLYVDDIVLMLPLAAF